MIKKYVFGTPFPTEAVTADVKAVTVGRPEAEQTEEAFPFGRISISEADGETGFTFTYVMDDADIVYGLGEANRGINKRGFRYVSDCTDDPNHTEDKVSLYGAHNFIIIAGKDNFGLFFDYPTYLTFDIGYTRSDTLKVTCAKADLNLYVMGGDCASGCQSVNCSCY